MIWRKLKTDSVVRYVCPFLLVVVLRAAPAQFVADLQSLLTPRDLALSSDGARLTYRLGADWWEISTAAGSKPARLTGRPAAIPTEKIQLPGATRPTSPLRSPDGAKIGYLDAATPDAALVLQCSCGGETQMISNLPVRAFQWSADGDSFWVLTSNGADIAFGRLRMNGRYEQMSQGAALRGPGGFVSANDVAAWVQSDGSHHGAIWIKNKVDKIYQLWDPNPETAQWSREWTQVVVIWKNAHGEELQGVLARPKGKDRVPLIVDPYSGWQNRFLNIGVLGNYAFVKAGFAVFFPNHRAPFAFPAGSFGEAYVGTSKSRDPVDVLTDDVMSGVEQLIRQGIADRDRMFLYSFSTGASAIAQLLTQTQAFRAAVSMGGVADWLGYYRANQPRGDETIPHFLGGRKPEDSPELYDRISAARHADRIKTPLRLIAGDKDSIPGGGSRYQDAVVFAEALRKAGSPVELVVYPGQGHGIDNATLATEHVRNAIEYFRSHMTAPRPLPR